jgi:hypothetical protein
VGLEDIYGEMGGRTCLWKYSERVECGLMGPAGLCVLEQRDPWMVMVDLIV